MAFFSTLRKAELLERSNRGRFSMHLARPKSSKGRSRPAVDGSLRAGGPHVDPKLPEGHPRGKLDGSLRSRSEPEIRQARRWDKEGVLHLLQQAPASPPASLNRYRVLPSIRNRRSVEGPRKSLDEMMLQLSLSDGAGARSKRPEEDRDDGQPRGEGARPGSPEAARPTTKAGSLLLAIRAPCGRRFEQLFDPADTLRAVKASAEARFVATYREAFIETMDMPRRTFTDMDMTLARCGILNRSVLCISQNGDRVQQNVK